MITVKDFLNKIKWDKREKPEGYTFFYLDRFENQLKEIKCLDIKRIEGNLIIIQKEGEEINIPMHRIKEIKKDNEIVWKRSF